MLLLLLRAAIIIVTIMRLFMLPEQLPASDDTIRFR